MTSIIICISLCLIIKLNIMSNFLEKEQVNFRIKKSDKIKFNQFCRDNNIRKSDFIRKAIFASVKNFDPEKETTSLDFINTETR